MKRAEFLVGFAALTKTFKSLDLDKEFLWEMCKEMTGMDFQGAILRIIKSHLEIYPNTNLIALINKYSMENLRDQALGKMGSKGQIETSKGEIGYDQ